MESSKVLQLFSGGKDSFLSTCKLLEEDNTVFLATFENGCGLCCENVRHGVDRLTEKYGKERVVFLGIYNISGIWREFFIPFFNQKPSEILEKYGEITFSQFNCLTCRVSMYIYSMALCKNLGIRKISDGARHDQGFVIELEPMLERFKRLLNDYELELLLPVLDMNSDWKRKNELLIHGFVPKTLEPQCLLGVPLKEGKQPDDDTIQGTIAFFDKEILNRCSSLIKKLEKVIREGGSEPI
jgi:hypothetical protein